MGNGFWIRRFFLALAIAGISLALAQWLKGHAPAAAVQYGALWGVISAALFTGIGYARYRKDPACMLPREDARAGEHG